MKREELIEKSPLRVLNPAAGEQPIEHRMGLVIARAGLGKTAVLVQLAMDAILRGNRVLHVSIGEGIEKAKVWYDNVCEHLAGGADQAASMQEELMARRMIMTFKESSFSRPKLEERLNDLVYQNIFRPAVVVIDGLDFTATDRAAVADVKELMEAMNVQVWFTALSHRDDARVGADAIPAPCHEVGELFDTVLELKAAQDGIKLNILKDTAGRAAGTALVLDPSTMMVQ